MVLVEISNETYRKKYINNFFQIDYSTGDRVTPQQLGYDVQLSLPL